MEWVDTVDTVDTRKIGPAKLEAAHFRYPIQTGVGQQALAKYLATQDHATSQDLVSAEDG